MQPPSLPPSVWNCVLCESMTEKQPLKIYSLSFSAVIPLPKNFSKNVNKTKALFKLQRNSVELVQPAGNRIPELLGLQKIFDPTINLDMEQGYHFIEDSQWV